MRDRVAILFALILCSAAAFAQETVFNVPSGDVLDRGEVYGELDVTYNATNAAKSFTPRVVIGVGHRVEVGLNVNGIGAPGLVQTTLAPTMKWKAYDGGDKGWALLVGDDVFFPAQNRAYTAGNYVYAEFTKTWKNKTRATFGAYDCSRHVVATGNRAGGQFAVEQPVSDKLTLAADWFTGHHALGYVTPGMIINVTPRFTWYASYQLGNTGLSNGNHQFLVELGLNLTRLRHTSQVSQFGRPEDMEWSNQPASHAIGR